MQILEGGRPGDERAFIHKSKIGKFFTSKAGGLAVGLVSGLLTKGKSRPTLPAGQGARPSGFSAAEKEGGRLAKFGGAGAPAFAATAPGFAAPGFAGPTPTGGRRLLPCPQGFRHDVRSGQCEPGGGQAVGEAVMGNYGAGLVPSSMIIDRQVCLRGMQLGNDGVCYNRSQIRNNQRMWPAGRKPLLTGGDMRAISTAARAGRRLEGATKRLQRLGMMKKPARRGVPRVQHQRLLEAHVTK